MKNLSFKLRIVRLLLEHFWWISLPKTLSWSAFKPLIRFQRIPAAFYMVFSNFLNRKSRNRVHRRSSNWTKRRNCRSGLAEECQANRSSRLLSNTNSYLKNVPNTSKGNSQSHSHSFLFFKLNFVCSSMDFSSFRWGYKSANYHPKCIGLGSFSKLVNEWCRRKWFPAW